MQRIALFLLLVCTCAAVAQEGTFLTDGWTPDYCNRVGVAVLPDAQPTGVMHVMARTDEDGVRVACAARLDSMADGCAWNDSGNHWTLWYTHDCAWQHMACHAMYQTQAHTQYRSLPRERWLSGCGQ